MKTRNELIQFAKNDILRFKMEHTNLFFVVQRKKRKVIAFLRKGGFGNGKVLKRATSHCRKDETFNEFIGKSLAAYRLFEESIPSIYLDTPQPTEAKIGDIIQYKENPTNFIYAPHSFSCRKEIHDLDYVTGRAYSLKKKEDFPIFVVDDTGYIEEHEWNRQAPSDIPTLDCYDRQKHTCDGRCQGLADCPMVDYAFDKNDKPSKKEMFEHIKELKRCGRENRQLYSLFVTAQKQKQELKKSESLQKEGQA